MNPTDLYRPSDESETQLIGALLIEPAYIAQAIAIVKPADFYLWEHARLFEAIAQLGEKADNLTVQLTLAKMAAADDKHANALAEIVATHGMVDVYLDLMRYESQSRGYVPNWELHAREVADHALRRRLFAYATNVARMANDQQRPAAELVDVAMAELTKAAADQHGGRRTMQEIAAAYWAERETEWANKGKPTGIPSGLADLDRMTNGWRPGQLVTVAGPTSSGKTTLMLQMALHAARQGRRVLVLTLEMVEEEIMRKLVANLGRLDTSHDATPNHDKEQAALNAALQLPIRVAYIPGPTVADVVAECHRERAKYGRLDLVMVDHLQIMATPYERGQTRAAALGAITRELKAQAGKLGAAILMGSQINREGATGANGPAPVPQLAMLRESGNIEEDSTMVLMLHNPETPTAPTLRTLYVRKNRNGPTGKVDLIAKLTESRFGLADVDQVNL